MRLPRKLFRNLQPNRDLVLGFTTDAGSLSETSAGAYSRHGRAIRVPLWLRANGHCKTDVSDTMARSAAYRDAAHQWDRAAAKEKPGKYRAEYEANAERNRALADGGASDDDGVTADAEPASSTRPTILN